MKSSELVSFPNMFEYIGGDVYNELIMTKAISDKEVQDLFIERVFMLEYKWFPLGDKPPKRKKYLRGVTKEKKKKQGAFDATSGKKRTIRNNRYPNQKQNNNNTSMNSSMTSVSSVNTVKLHEKLLVSIRHVL